MADTVVYRDTFPNYSGMLFRKGNTSTPFTSVIGTSTEVTDHDEFACGVFYDAAAGAQPEISEADSVTAPDATAVSRTQATNVTQIFQYAVNVSYAKQSAMGSISGLNIAGDVANPPNELDFQVARKLEKANADIEYSFIRGKKQKATSSAVAAKTGGILEAITTNVIQVGTSSAAAALSFWKVAEAIEAIAAQGGNTANLVLGVGGAALLQLNKDISENQYTQGITTLAGINVQTVVTPFGQIRLLYIPTLNAVGEETSNTAIVFDPSIIHPVTQTVPGHGTGMFLEPLAKTGASDRYQLFGQYGLDYGAEFFAAKLTNISNSRPTGTL